MRDTKNQYPPQTGLYKVKAKHGDNWKNHKHARLQISVGQEYHEGEKLKSTIEWALARFETVTVCVNDTLQRNSIRFSQKITPEQALSISRNMGDEWIERNKPYLSDPKITIKRWDEWISHPDFESIHAKLDYVYRVHDEFCKALEENILDFWQRRKEKYPDTYTPDRYPFFYKSSRDYLLEEGAVFILMNKIQEGIDIYPGTILKCFTTMKKDERFGSLFNRSFLRIDYSKNEKAA